MKKNNFYEYMFFSYTLILSFCAVIVGTSLFLNNTNSYLDILKWVVCGFVLLCLLVVVLRCIKIFINMLENKNIVKTTNYGYNIEKASIIIKDVLDEENIKLIKKHNSIVIGGSLIIPIILAGIALLYLFITNPQKMGFIYEMGTKYSNITIISLLILLMILIIVSIFLIDSGVLKFKQFASKEIEELIKYFNLKEDYKEVNIKSINNSYYGSGFKIKDSSISYKKEIIFDTLNGIQIHINQMEEYYNDTNKKIPVSFGIVFSSIEGQYFENLSKAQLIISNVKGVEYPSKETIKVENFNVFIDDSQNVSIEQVVEICNVIYNIYNIPFDISIYNGRIYLKIYRERFFDVVHFAGKPFSKYELAIDITIIDFIKETFERLMMALKR